MYQVTEETERNIEDWTGKKIDRKWNRLVNNERW